MPLSEGVARSTNLSQGVLQCGGIADSCHRLVLLIGRYSVVQVINKAEQSSHLIAILRKTINSGLSADADDNDNGR